METSLAYLDFHKAPGLRSELGKGFGLIYSRPSIEPRPMGLDLGPFQL